MIDNPVQRLSHLLAKTEGHLETFRELMANPKAKISEKSLTQLVKNLAKDESSLAVEIKNSVTNQSQNKELTKLQQHILRTIGFLQTDQKTHIKMNQLGSVQAALWAILETIKRDVSKLNKKIIHEKGENIEKVEMWTLKHFIHQDNSGKMIAKLEVTSPAFENGKSIPVKYTGEGENVSPALFFRNLPDTIQSIAIIVDDPDAPSGTFSHWLAWNIPGNLEELPENAVVPNQGKNGFGRTNYMGPYPPLGQTHRYFFRVYALDKFLNLSNSSNRAQLEDMIKSHVLAYGELVGTYRR